MTEHVKEDFCVSCAVAAGALFAGGATVKEGMEIEEEENQDNGIFTKDVLIWGGILLIIAAILIYFFGGSLIGCSTCA